MNVLSELLLSVRLSLVAVATSCVRGDNVMPLLLKLAPLELSVFINSLVGIATLNDDFRVTNIFYATNTVVSKDECCLV